MSNMSPARAPLSRRQFLKMFSAAGGGLMLGIAFPTAVDAAPIVPDSSEANVFAPDAFIRIAPSGQVTLIMPRVEMGQGSYTSIPMLIAEELEIALDNIALEHAPANDVLYRDPVIGSQITGASASTRSEWLPMRQAGAACRVLLVNAAAMNWKADPASCRAENGTVRHVPTGRTLSYGPLSVLAAKLPLPHNVALKDPRTFKLVGTPVKRLDARAKVDGSAGFGIDVRVPGMRIATVAASPVVGGRLKSVDARRALQIAGVKQVVQIDDAVAVVADHMWAAKQGLAALVIEWDDGVNARFSNASLIAKMEQASANDGVVAQHIGDVANALNGKGNRIEARYELPFLAHATMEPMNCTVHVTLDGCDVWCGTQVPARAQATAAEVTGLSLEKVRVHNQYLGGGFGRRLEVDYVTQSVRFAKQVQGPVKFVWSREEDIQQGLPRTYYLNRFEALLDSSGQPQAWAHKVTGAAVMARYLPSTFKNGVDPDAVNGAINLLYDIPNVKVNYVRYETPMPIGKWRGVGPTHNVFVVESFMDELAHAAGKDPFEYRRALLAHQPRAKRVLETAASEAGWTTPLPAAKRGVRIGRGISVQFAFASYLAEVAEVEVNEQGQVRIRRIVCAVDCGHTVNPDTIRAQIEGGIVFASSAVLWGEITFRNGRIEQGNFNDYRVMRINEAPAIETHIIDSAEAPGGIGEAGTSALFPAVANAVAAATGTRIRKLPINPAMLKV
ncbi:xanthine dehydrogenase family protein molybdopterin-binding subunit [Paraburkholderia fynbosensis]|uniref:Isoquinoline 1-oxidoreductase subunit beta n=1 Tax=Paraburkholderia fynbosensis TaxID=1200993 RepID=A0A6J5GNR2_9BURK|nr:xanthine dehydrogenase family protein molybdopterin-binding subunit [Paraburkholderia fynbosensis]CAB3804288.1 Isoquinoline 1-oxidoreductase subunit beta [Paraburkholderia fynbosensis]